MPSFKTERVVPFTPDQMFAVVADVEAYPEFLPMCDGLVITQRSAIAEGEELIATMTVGYKHIRERFTTRVRLLPRAREILVSYVDGPFSHLENEWRFREAGSSATTVQFAIDYAFRSPMLGLIVGGAFDKAVRNYTTAFETRAQMLYGKRSIP